MRSRVTIIRESGDTISFDSWVEGTFDGSATLTKHPIEDGSKTSDHSQADPKRVTLSVKQSEAPLHADNGPFGIARIQETFRILEEIGRSGEQITVDIPRAGSFDNMALARWPGTMRAGNSTEFEIVVERIDVAQTFFVNVPIEAIAPPARAGHQEEVDQGTQAAEETEETAGGFFDNLLGGADESILSEIF